MAYITKRFYTQGTGFASSIAAKFLRNASKNGPTTRAQLLDSNQVQKLSLVLNRPHLYLDTPITSDPLPDGTPIPPGYHLVFFTPSAIEQDLSIDGTDRSVNPPHPFTRRMWAGGELIWTGKENPLRVGQIVRETTELVSAEAKKSKTGDEMIIVGTKKTFANENGIALVDKRNWVFRKGISGSKPQIPQLGDPKPREGNVTRDFCQSDVSLFRFSALTLNAHKIHYSRDWCRNVENHRDLVVHGPLNLINMLDFWRDTEDEGGYAIPKSINYRAVSPLYVGEQYRAILEREEKTRSAKQTLYASDGTVAMKGDIFVA